MLIYHCHSNDNDSNVDFKKMKNKKKSSKKGYKKACKRKSACHSINAVEAGVSKKSKVPRKKKSKVPRKKSSVLRNKKSKVLRKKLILKKNVKLLEGLGLKVKQQQ